MRINKLKDSCFQSTQVKLAISHHTFWFQNEGQDKWVFKPAFFFEPTCLNISAFVVQPKLVVDIDSCNLLHMCCCCFCRHMYTWQVTMNTWSFSEIVETIFHASSTYSLDQTNVKPIIPPKHNAQSKFYHQSTNANGLTISIYLSYPAIFNKINNATHKLSIYLQFRILIFFLPGRKVPMTTYIFFSHCNPKI